MPNNQDFTNLRLKHSTPEVHLVAKVKELASEHDLTHTEAITITVDAIRVGDFETLGQTYLCRTRLIENLRNTLKPEIFIDKIRGYNLDDKDVRRSLWRDVRFRDDLADYAGVVTAKSLNKFWNKNPLNNDAIQPVNIADFWKENYADKDHFMLSFAWIDMERYIYNPPITLENLDDGLINAYADSTKDGTDNTNNPEPDFQATYY